MKINKICICCPMGCHLEINDADRNNISVTGNRCPRGDAYGIEEIFAPKRMITAVVKTDSAVIAYAPVRTSKPLPREKMVGLLKMLYGMEAKVPVVAGGVLLANFEQTGVDVVFTRTINK